MILVRKTNSNHILQICKNKKFLYFVNRNKDTLLPAKLIYCFFNPYIVKFNLSESV